MGTTTDSIITPPASLKRATCILYDVHSDEIAKLGDLEERHWWYAERRHLIRRAIRGVEPTGWALDVGAAAGGNTRVMRAAGWDCLALEYSETGALLAQGRGLTVVRGDATRIPVADAALGLVVAYDVLEHIEDDGAAAAEIFRCLLPGGLLLVAVPADMRLWSAHDEAVDHVRRYGRTELLALIEDAGFTNVSIRSWNVLLRPVVAMRRKKATASDLDKPGRITNIGLRGIVVAERALPVGVMPGVTLLLSARKPRR
jgi:SAM-dependent methyltransferase